MRSLNTAYPKMWNLRLLSSALVATVSLNASAIGDQDAEYETSRNARWHDDVVVLTLDPSMQALGDDAFDALVGAVAAWQNVASDIPLLVVERGTSAVPDDVNLHTIRYAPRGDPMANGALAITIITYDNDGQSIIDADIVVNGEHPFAILGTPNAGGPDEQTAYDLQNVLTHELGHLLGLDEERHNQDSTMFESSAPCETDKRDLHAADIGELHRLYAR